MVQYVHLTDAQWQLYELMSQISEDCHCAGWLGECEYDIWHALHHEDPWAPNFMDRRLLRLCKKVSTEIEGWIYWTDSPQFAPMAQWLEMVAKRRKLANPD
jgi:hypothetical protein